MEHGAYTGCEFNRTDEDTEDEELLTRLSDLQLDGNAVVTCEITLF